MLLKVVTKEEPSIRTLSYAPGPLNNEMQQHVRETLGDQEQKQLYTKMADEVNFYNDHKLSFFLLFKHGLTI